MGIDLEFLYCSRCKRHTAHDCSWDSREGSLEWCMECERQVSVSNKRTVRLYSLFDRVPCISGKLVYRRISAFAYPKPQAVKVFQDALLAPALGANVPVRCLRPVKD